MFTLTQIEPQLYAAFGPGGTLAGRGSRSHLLHGLPVCPGQQFLKVEVQPQFRGQGAGTALYAALEHDARLAGATSLACAVTAGDDLSLRFATSRGFRVDYEMLDSELDMAGFDLGRWEGAVSAAEIHGIRFTTLLQAQDEHGLLQNLYELDRDLSRDVPDWSGVMPPLAAYEASLAECDPAAVFIAWAEGRPVGYSMTGADGYTHFMGVARVFRGKGIALALKVLTIRWALSKGVACLSTNNNAANAAILGLNRKLGYTSRLGTIYLVKE